MSRRARGFTIFELLVVMVLIAITAALVIGAISRVGHQTRKGESSSRLRSLVMALNQYREDWGDVPPYNPRGEDFDADGAADPAGPGLYALVMLNYAKGYRLLADPAAGIRLPWVLNGGNRLEVVPGDVNSMGTAYQALINGGWTVGTPLGPQEEYATYVALADPAFHGLPASLPTDYGQFEGYDIVGHENYCSWQMADPYSTEWKYLPVRQGEPSPSTGGPSGTAFPVDDPLGYANLYHRQLSHRWTDEDSPAYRPAADTVVSWSNLYRDSERRPANGVDDWGQDLVIFADGHVATIPGPADSAATSWAEGRAVQRAPLP